MTAPTPQSKARYVLAQSQTRPHTCHWPGCAKQVPPAMWGCKPHWMRLPKRLRDRLWAAYVPGQERDGKVTAAYFDAAHAIEDWILTQEDI